VFSGVDPEQKLKNFAPFHVRVFPKRWDRTPDLLGMPTDIKFHIDIGGDRDTECFLKFFVFQHLISVISQ
jgi:hypothetical protein